MPNLLGPVRSAADLRLNVETFNNEAPRYYDRASRLLRETTYWVFDPLRDWFGPSKFVGFAGMDFDRYLQAVAGDSNGVRFDGGVTRTAISYAVGLSFEDDEGLRAELETWGIDRFGPDAFGGADRTKWRFLRLPEAIDPVTARLPLALHGRFTRADVYGVFAINYDTRATRHLNMGLSPAMPDGGYFIFVTLDKSTIERTTTTKTSSSGNG